MNKIVFVEDEPEVGALIAAYLGKHDMDVVVEPRATGPKRLLLVNNPIWYCWISCCLAKTG